MAAMTLTVSALNAYVQRKLNTDPFLHDVRLKGELTDFKAYRSGHLYFRLKDANAVVAGVMYADKAAGLNFTPADGQSVVVTGYVTLYAKSGSYQINVQTMRPEGEGAINARIEALRRKLEAEGLFAREHKLPLPLLSKNIAIITSSSGAVRYDIEVVAKRRNPYVNLVLFPVNVQGENAAPELTAALRSADSQGFDVIIIGRGGGSVEELWAFNDEALARAIYACKTPVISAVGHEVNFTLVDLVADRRAATPSEAAELAVADRGQLLAAIADRERRLRTALRLYLQGAEALITKYEGRMSKYDPAHMLELEAARQAARAEKLAKALYAALGQLDARLDAQKARLRLASPEARLDGESARLAASTASLTRAAEAAAQRREQALDTSLRTLKALDPQRVLMRGYAIVSAGGRTVMSANSLNPGDRLNIRLRDGEVDALTLDVKGELPV